jgi:hypothetical protein
MSLLVELAHEHARRQSRVAQLLGEKSKNTVAVEAP